MDLKAALEKLLQDATDCADDWNDVGRKFDGRRSFPTFLEWLQDSELDWHYELNADSQPDRWRSLQAPSYGTAQLAPNLASDSNWDMATIYYNRSLWLMQLLQGIHSESDNDFSREQAGLLASFLDHLMKIQQEQRVVAYVFSEQLEHLRKYAAAAPLPSCEAAELGNLSGDISSSLGGACTTKAVEETLEVVEEAIQKLTTVEFSIFSSEGRTPPENITCWRVLVESSLANLQLDLICKKHSEAIRLGVDAHSVNRLHEGISSLLSAGDKLILDYVAMHRTVAEITYMVADAFTTGGAGMKDLSDETVSIEMDFDMDFPWDKHNIPDAVKYDMSHPDIQQLTTNPGFFYGSDSDDNFK